MDRCVSLDLQMSPLYPLNVPLFTVHRIRTQLLVSDPNAYLDFGVHGSGQEQVSRFWKVTNGRDALGVSSVSVQQLLWYKTGLRSRFAIQVDIQIQRHMHVGTSHVVVLLLAVEYGRL